MVFDQNRGFLTDPPVKTDNGYLILRVDERHRPGQASFEEVQKHHSGTAVHAAVPAQGARVSYAVAAGCVPRDQRGLGKIARLRLASRPAGPSGSIQARNGHQRRSGQHTALKRILGVPIIGTKSDRSSSKKDEKRIRGWRPIEIHGRAHSMKSPYIADLEPSQWVTGTFLVQSKDVRQKKGGEHFLSLMLSDRTGDIDAKMWDNVDRLWNAFP